MHQTTTIRIRPAEPKDREGAYVVCLQTGDSGGDGTRLYHDDPHALGNRYVGPYLSLEPQLAFVLEDEQGVCGYCLAALHSPSFYQRMRDEWLPPLQRRHPKPPQESSNSWTPVQRLYQEFHAPSFHFPPRWEESYPSHLHIDLLPRVQGQGWGHRMMEMQLAKLRSLGSKGVHLGMSSINDRALGFYTKLGFRAVARIDQTRCQELPLDSPARPPHELFLGLEFQNQISDLRVVALDGVEKEKKEKDQTYQTEHTENKRKEDGVQKVRNQKNPANRPPNQTNKKRTKNDHIRKN